jgi:coproporphyrinogen III oxidase
MGYGVTAVMQKGDLLEKAAVSTTIVKGQLSTERAAAISSRTKRDDKITVGSQYFAAAISLVLHSRSPMVPTFRSDIRFFELGGDDEDERLGWFGGGADLTPYYLFDEDAQEFHSKYSSLCSQTEGGDALYRRMKNWCDQYFFLPARGEHRGVGGIFYDDLSSLKATAAGDETAGLQGDKHSRAVELDKAMKFTQSVCDEFMPSYLPIARRRRAQQYTEEQRHWQLLRRGRYIEFNMLCKLSESFHCIYIRIYLFSLSLLSSFDREVCFDLLILSDLSQ